MFILVNSPFTTAAIFAILIFSVWMHFTVQEFSNDSQSPFFISFTVRSSFVRPSLPTYVCLSSCPKSPLSLCPFLSPPLLSFFERARWCCYVRPRVGSFHFLCFEGGRTRGARGDLHFVLKSPTRLARFPLNILFHHSTERTSFFLTTTQLVHNVEKELDFKEISLNCICEG